MATKEEKESVNSLEACFKSIIKTQPPNEIPTRDRIISTLYLQEENNSSRSFSSGYSGGYYSYGENLNGGGSSGFSQNGGGHHNFYGRVDRLR
jgi:hypothetical protein